MGLLLTPVGDRLNAIIDRGDDQTLRLTVTDSSGAILDVSAATVRCTVKKYLDDDISAAIFQLTNPSVNGIDLGQGAQGIVDVNFANAFDAALAGPYLYDVQMVLSGKQRTLVPSSAWFVRKNISTPGSAPSPPSPLVPFPGDIQVIGGNIYVKDTGSGPNAGKYWKLVVQDGVFDVQGPSITVPF